MIIILAIIYIIRYNFIIKKFAKKICQVFKIKPYYSIKFKLI